MIADRLLAVDPEAPALVAVSGGRDSVALLHLLLERGCKHLAVCHLDHALRAESADDARFVAQLAERLRLPLACERIDVAAISANERISIEMAARKVRYAAFARMARHGGQDKVYVAHHADDQVETLLLNLFRGSAAAGLRGMQPVSHQTIDSFNLTVIRPMLGIWGGEIAKYVQDSNLKYREDASNLDLSHTRNRMRRNILPFLEAEFGREIKRSIWRAAEVLQQENALIASLPIFAEASADAPDLDARAMAKLHPALQRRILYRWLRANCVADVGYEDVEAVRALLGNGKPSKANLSGGLHARRRAGRLFIDRDDDPA